MIPPHRIRTPQRPTPTPGGSRPVRAPRSSVPPPSPRYSRSRTAQPREQPSALSLIQGFVLLSARHQLPEVLDPSERLDRPFRLHLRDIAGLGQRSLESSLRPCLLYRDSYSSAPDTNSRRFSTRPSASIVRSASISAI